MPVVTLDCIVLQVFPYGETSRILRLLTTTHGVQSAMAKGARRPKSPFGGLLESFTEGVATIYMKETRELQTLSHFELTRSRQVLGSDLMRFGGASLLAEIVLRTAGEEPQPDLFALIGSALGRIESEPVASVEAVVLSEVWRLIACLGFAPEIERCIDCDRRIADDEDVKFDYAAGGVRCLDCATGEAGQPIPARARLALIAMAARNDVGIERTRGHWTLLQRYLQHHVLEGAQLRSLAFLADARAGDPCDD